MQLAATMGKPALIMTPTRTHWPDGLADDCQKRKCLLVDLASLIAINGSAWVAAGDDWQACLAAFCRYADLALPASWWTTFDPRVTTPSRWFNPIASRDC